MLDVLVGSWNQLREPLKGWWSKLTDDDLDNINANMTVSSVCFRKSTATVLNRPASKSSNAWRNTNGDIGH